MARKRFVISWLICTATSANAQTNQPITLQSDAVITLPANAGLAALADGDFNHDGRRDIAVCERGLDQVALYMRSATGTYPSAAFTYAVGQAPSGLVSFNRSNSSVRYDLMAVSGPSSQWTMLRDDNDPTGNLVRRVLTPGFGTGQASMRPVLVQADVDLDGTPDFVYTYPLYFNSFVRAQRYFNDTNAPSQVSSLQPYSTTYFNTVQNASTSITLADFDQNGRLDQALPDSANNKVHFISYFQASRQALQTTGLGPVHVAAQDIDADLLPDVAIAYSGSNEVIVLRTTTTFDFNRGYSYQLTASPRRVLLADLNRDNRPELLVVTANNELLLYRHNGQNTSLCYTTYPPQVLATGVNPAMLQTALLDGDNYPDVIVGCSGDNTVRTYLTRINQTTAAQSARPLADVAVYPTLATDQLTIQQPGRLKLTASLLDEVGRVVQQQTLTESMSAMSVSGLPRGVYILRLVGQEGTKNTRIVLQ